MLFRSGASVGAPASLGLGWGGIPIAVAVGSGAAKGLQTNAMQRVIAGQSQADLLDKLSNAKVGSLKLSDILRQGTAGGATSLINSGE